MSLGPWRGLASGARAAVAPALVVAPWGLHVRPRSLAAAREQQCPQPCQQSLATSQTAEALHHEIYHAIDHVSCRKSIPEAGCIRKCFYTRRRPVDDGRPAQGSRAGDRLRPRRAHRAAQDDSSELSKKKCLDNTRGDDQTKVVTKPTKPNQTKCIDKPRDTHECPLWVLRIGAVHAKSVGARPTDPAAPPRAVENPVPRGVIQQQGNAAAHALCARVSRVCKAV